MPDLKKMLTLEALSEALPSWLKRSTKPEYNADEIDSTLTTNQFVSASDKENWNAKGTYSKPSGGIPKSDLSSIVQTSLEKADSALQSETDPTVPSWAKQTNKPSYTQDEVADGSTYKRVTQTEKDTWSGKQNALTTTQMQAVNSGITAEGVAQISTNQANALYVLDKTGKNLWNITLDSLKSLNSSGYTWNDRTATHTATGITFTVNSDMTITVNGTVGASNLVFNYGEISTEYNGCMLSSTPDTSTKYRTVVDNVGYDTGNGILLTNTVARNAKIELISNNSISNVTFKPMICTLADWTISPNYVPYSKSNAQLTRDCTVNNSRIYAQATEPTDNDIPEGSTWANGASVKGYSRTAQLIDESQIKQGGCSVTNGAYVINTNRVCIFNVPVVSGKTYTATPANMNLASVVYFNNDTFVSGNFIDSSINYSFTIPSGVNNVALTYKLANEGTITPSDLVQPMMNEGSSALPYTPYLTWQADPALTEVVDEGAKNIFNIFTAAEVKAETITRTINADGTVTVSNSGTNTGTATLTYRISLVANTQYVISGCPSGGSDNTYSLSIRTTSAQPISDAIDYGSGSGVFTVPTSGEYVVYLRVAANYAFSDKIFKPMVCIKAAFDISQKFVPYRALITGVYAVMDKTVECSTTETTTGIKFVASEKGNYRITASALASSSKPSTLRVRQKFSSSGETFYNFLYTESSENTACLSVCGIKNLDVGGAFEVFAKYEQAASNAFFVLVEKLG